MSLPVEVEETNFLIYFLRFLLLNFGINSFLLFLLFEFVSMTLPVEVAGTNFLIYFLHFW